MIEVVEELCYVVSISSNLFNPRCRSMTNSSARTLKMTPGLTWILMMRDSWRFSWSNGENLMSHVKFWPHFLVKPSSSYEILLLYRLSHTTDWWNSMEDKIPIQTMKVRRVTMMEAILVQLIIPFSLWAKGKSWLNGSLQRTLFQEEKPIKASASFC